MSFSLKYDFDFQSDGSNRFIVIVFGFLMYCMTIAAMSGLFTYNTTKGWSDTLNGKLTVEFPSAVDGNSGALTEKQNIDVVAALLGTPGVVRAKKLKEADMLKILEPWLSSTAIPDDFPFPTLFSVETDRLVDVDLLALTSKLSKISQGVRIHNHASWYTPISKISQGLFGFSALLLFFILVTVIATIILITKKTLVGHKNSVKVLQIIGAQSNYIAKQFNKYYFSLSLKGALISIVMSCGTIWAVNYLMNTNWMSLENIKYVIISVLVPFFSMIVVMLTSKSTVMYFLKTEDWID